MTDRTKATQALPWQIPPLDEWEIVRLNHFFEGHEKHEKHLYVAMAWQGRIIFCSAPDEDDFLVWGSLRAMARAHMAEKEGLPIPACADAPQLIKQALCEAGMVPVDTGEEQ